MHLQNTTWLAWKNMMTFWFHIVFTWWWVFLYLGHLKIHSMLIKHMCNSNCKHYACATVCGPWSTRSLVGDFSEHDKVFRLEKNIWKKNECVRWFMISLLSYGKVSAFLLLVKAWNSSLLTGRLTCLSWSLYFCSAINYVVMFTWPVNN